MILAPLLLNTRFASIEYAMERTHCHDRSRSGGRVLLERGSDSSRDFTVESSFMLPTFLFTLINHGHP